jgi:hypothetical protein
MAAPSSLARLTDILEAVEPIRSEVADATVRSFELDRRKRWLVEREIEIICEASRHLPEARIGRDQTLSQGLIRTRPQPSNPPMSRVTTLALWRRAMDAIMRSTVAAGLPIRLRTAKRSA